MYKHILVATDGSELSQTAVNSAVALAATCGADLTAVTVVAPYQPVYFEGSVLMSAQEVQALESGWTAAAQKLVHAVKVSAAKHDVQAKAITMKSDSVSDAILTAAKKYKCDLIVMASHGRKGLVRVLLGSETQQVLTHSKLPVLILR
jgi:nucleotide-binding universal stress UspA family protein